MKDELVDQQSKKLYAHVKEALQADQVSKKAESAIFDKHRLAEGGYGPGLRDELNECRQSHANQWGPEGWRHEEFVKKQILDIQTPTEDQMEQMANTAKATDQDDANENQQQNREEFLTQLKGKRQQPPKPRLG